MKNVLRILGVMILALSVTGCFIFETPPIKSALQMSSKGIDSNTVQIFYSPLDAIGQKVAVNANSSITNITLDSALSASNNTNPRAVTVTGDTVEKCAVSASAEGCFQVFINATGGKTGVSGKISFTFNGIALTLNYSGSFRMPPASVAVSSTEGVDTTSFKVRFTAKTAANAAYVVNKTGITQEALVNLTQTSTGLVSPRAVGVNSVVTCDPINTGEGCFQVTLSNRPTGTKTVNGSVSFNLDGVALNLPFSHSFPTAAP